ncbi:MAG: zf-HC2 domain-containing protein [Candidatus Auribacterota bacterium]|nr:zf-HC2 domain-containing protein [Candidatus Auribacterota bacterium]
MKECPDKEMLSRYLDGEISVKERHSVEEHLSKCGKCRSRLSELKEVETPLKEIFRSKKPVGKGKAGCIGEERIIAYLEDHLPEKVRQKVAAHLGSCRYCSQVATEAREALKTIEAVRSRGLKKTPERLTRKAAAIFTPTKISHLGSIIVELKELVLLPIEELTQQQYIKKGGNLYCSEPAPERLMKAQDFHEGAGGDLDSDEIMDSRFEEKPELAFKKSTGGVARRAAAINPSIEWAYKKQWMNLVVSFTTVKHGEARCIITLKDGLGLPVPGVSMHVSGDSTKPFFKRTDENGAIELVVFAHGNYKLRIDYRQGMTLDMKIK